MSAPILTSGTDVIAGGRSLITQKHGSGNNFSQVAANAKPHFSTGRDFLNSYKDAKIHEYAREFSRTLKKNYILMG